MTHVWTWGGRYFGYFDGDDLWTHDGRHVGRRDGDEIFGTRVQYLGEVMDGDRLITSLAKGSRRKAPFGAWGRRAGVVPYVNYVGYVMYLGYTDFPAPEAL
jgi:hypothetical protein